MTPRLGPGALAARLAALPVHVTSAEVTTRAVPLPDYPGEPRPSGLLCLSGPGHVGHGENVAFTMDEQRSFAAVVAAWFHEHGDRRNTTVASALPQRGTPYERAAIEAALVDLALREAGVSLAGLTGVSEAALRFVVSLSASSDPLPEMQRLRAAGYEGDFKIDVDPSWPRDTLSALGNDRRVVIVDFKQRGDAAFARDVAAAIPHARLEDPSADFEDASGPEGATRISRDASLIDEAAVSRALARSESVNLKAPRMGGPLAVLRSLEQALDADVPCYLGGMFEVDVGREQARQLAALYCPRAPNDLAPNRSVSGGERRTIESPPTRVRLDVPGFGARRVVPGPAPTNLR